MMTTTLIYSIITVLVAVLNIILFFKLWGACNNISEMNRKMDGLLQHAKGVPVTVAGKVVKTGSELIGGEMMTYDVYDDGTVVFKDGIKAKMRNTPPFSSSVLTDDGYELVYQNYASAIRAAYVYGSEKKEAQANFVKKQLFKA